MATTMLAYQYAYPSPELKLSTIPIPNPSPDCILIKIHASGLCHTDLHILSSHFTPYLPNTLTSPLTLGHEIAGVVSSLPSPLPSPCPFNIGDRVAVSLPGHNHAHEEPNWSAAVGMGLNGGYAEYVLVPTHLVLPIPKDVSFAAAAVAGDSVLAAYHAVRYEAEVKPGMVVGIIGLGGVGLQGVRVGAMLGGEVWGVDLDEGKFGEGVRCGAKGCVKRLADVEGGKKFDVVVDFVGARGTVGDAVRAVKAGGRVVLVGMGSPTLELETMDVVTRRVQIRGSMGAGIEEFGEVLDLIAKGKLKPVLEEIAFEDVAEGLRRIESGKVVGRLWTDPSKKHEI